MALILRNDPNPEKADRGPQWSCCGKLFRDGPCGCPKPAEALEADAAPKKPEVRSAEAMEAIRDTLTAILERLNLPGRKSA